MTSRIAVVGSREFWNVPEIKARIMGLPLDATIVSGGAKGPDSIAVRVAETRRMKTQVFPADWSKGRGAGLARNTTIVEDCDQVLAFWDGESRGTADTIEKAKKAGKPVQVVMDLHTRLQDFFDEILDLNAGSFEKQRPTFDRATAPYLESSRFYHTPTHISRLLDNIGLLERQKVTNTGSKLMGRECLQVLGLAAFYHDYYLGPLGEERSADLAYHEVSEATGNPGLAQYVKGAVLATQHFKEDVDLQNPAFVWMRDLDLMILGAPWEEYAEYMRRVCWEYSRWSARAYGTGRIKALRHFLDRRQIYQDLYIKAAYEEAARHNLEVEIRYWEEKTR